MYAVPTVHSRLTVANTRSRPPCLDLLPILYRDLELFCFAAGIIDNSTPEPTCSVCLGLSARLDEFGDFGDSPTIAIFKASSKQGCWGCKVMMDLFHAQDLGQGGQYSMQLFSLNITFDDNLHMAVWSTEKKPKYSWTATLMFSILSFPGMCFC
jgi:hypothetical protein